MGQQQLLLIVLGVIIVGIAVVVGINIFNTSSESSAKDTVSSELMQLGAMAQQFYKKPLEMGGGGNTFADWEVPGKMDTTQTAIYVAGTGSTTEIEITATPVDAAYTWEATCTVTKDAISVEFAEQ